MANLFKGNILCTTHASRTKLYEHCLVITIQKCKFREIPFTGYLVMTQFADFKQFKGNNLLHAEAIQTKCINV